jgi:UDP-N-acetylglucosamine 4,6-dehydratase/5-epimerase
MHVGGFLAGKKALVTGGSGSIGSEIVRQVLDGGAGVVRVFSRDETRQATLAHTLKAGDRVRFLIGDVRDRERLKRALEGVEIVFHAAALKHVPACEYNPFEAVQTNVVGTQNVLTAAREAGVRRVVLVSTDKAVSPVNTMGATKLLAERLIASAHQSMGGMTLCAVRFGNVLGSRGSLLPLVRSQIARERSVHVTDRSMTRFFMTIGQAVRLVLRAAQTARGGEILVLRMPKVRLMDLLEVLIAEESARRGLAPEDIHVNEIGCRPGERLHERLLTTEECERAFVRDGVVVIPPQGTALPEGAARLLEAEFSSETGPFLDRAELAALVREASREEAAAEAAERPVERTVQW